MSKRILVVLSEWGYWGEELVEPLDLFDTSGYQTTFVTPTGQRPAAIPASMDPTFVDPPLGRIVVTEEVAAKVRAIDSPQNPRLNSPVNLTQWFPEPPYLSSPTYLRDLEQYNARIEQLAATITAQFDALLLVGGSGPLFDMANNFRVKELIRIFYHANKPIAAECYGTACLAFTTISDENPIEIIRGKHVTGHPVSYDYHDGWGIWDANHDTYIVARFPLIPLQKILESAVGDKGLFHGNVGREFSVVVDYPFITGRTTNDSRLTAAKLQEVLEMGLTRYGF